MPGCLLCVFSFSNASVEFESSALYFDTVEENILGGGGLCAIKYYWQCLVSLKQYDGEGIKRFGFFILFFWSPVHYILVFHSVELLHTE